MNIAARAALGALLLAGFSHAAQPAAAASDTHHHDADHQLVGAAASGGLPSVPLEIGELEVARVQRYVHDVQADEVARYLVAVAAEEERLRLAAEAAARPSPVPVQSAGSSVRSGGGHSDAWWHGVANCEQGGRNDPYFGYFSFVDGSMGGQPWDVQVAAGNAVLANSASESPAWAPSCVAAGYAASPGG